MMCRAKRAAGRITRSGLKHCTAVEKVRSGLQNVQRAAVASAGRSGFNESQSHQQAVEASVGRSGISRLQGRQPLHQ